MGYISSWSFPGARWWKFDFHTHTPASRDFLQECEQQVKDEFTPTFWLQKFMEREIDCVAITDHNSGEWIDQLKNALGKLEQEKPNWYHPLLAKEGQKNCASVAGILICPNDPTACLPNSYIQSV